MSGNLDYLSDCLVCFWHAVKLVNFVETCILCTKIVITFERSKKNKNSRTLFFPDYQATLSPTVYYLFTFIKKREKLAGNQLKMHEISYYALAKNILLEAAWPGGWPPDLNFVAPEFKSCSDCKMMLFLLAPSSTSLLHL